MILVAPVVLGFRLRLRRLGPVEIVCGVLQVAGVFRVMVVEERILAALLVRIVVVFLCAVVVGSASGNVGILFLVCETRGIAKPVVGVGAVAVESGALFLAVVGMSVVCCRGPGRPLELC